MTPEDNAYFKDAMNAPSDIAAAILLAIRLEAGLDECILLRFSRRDDDTVELLCKDNGALGTFFSKIGLGYALGIYDKEFMEHINIIRRIRNAFAHSRRPMSFAHQLVRGELHSLKLPDKDDDRHKYLKLAKDLTDPKMPLTAQGKQDMDNSLALTGRAAYAMLCMSVEAPLLRDQNRILHSLSGRLLRQARKLDQAEPKTGKANSASGS